MNILQPNSHSLDTQWSAGSRNQNGLRCFFEHCFVLPIAVSWMNLAAAELPTLTLLKKFRDYCPFKTQWKLLKCDRIKHYEFYQRTAFMEFVFFSELTTIICLKMIN
jgi:hypothetical protein